MAKKCELTGTGPMYGNNVSHSNCKTRRRFEPNLHVISLASDSLKRTFSLRITAATLRTVEHNGGLDDYLTTTADRKLTETAIRLKRQIKKAKIANSAA
ncbi:MAG: 50S ribosomal protein L28 [Pseudomonadota bacterium]